MLDGDEHGGSPPFGKEKSRMNIALVGGIERNEAELTQIARRAGHTLEYHGGHIGGRGADGLRSLVERADLVVLQTLVNSHGSMYLAKKVARQLGKGLVIVRTFGPAKLEALLGELEEGVKPFASPSVGCCA
jgi:hypothetical protein